jgi:hypothetical protein
MGRFTGEIRFHVVSLMVFTLICFVAVVTLGVRSLRHDEEFEMLKIQMEETKELNAEMRKDLEFLRGALEGEPGC